MAPKSRSRQPRLLIGSKGKPRPDMCRRCAGDVPEMCRRVPEMCRRSAGECRRSAGECRRCAGDVPEMCRSVPDMCRTRASQIYLVWYRFRSRNEFRARPDLFPTKISLRAQPKTNVKQNLFEDLFNLLGSPRKFKIATKLAIRCPPVLFPPGPSQN